MRTRNNPVWSSIKRVFVLACALSCVLANVQVGTAHALSKPQTKLYENNILYYDIGGDCGGVQAASNAVLTGNNVQKAFTYLSTTGGYDATHAAAIVGNMIIESNVDPTITNSIGAHGIVQWLGGRLTSERAFAASIGKDPDDLIAQLAFVAKEAKDGIGLFNNSTFIGKTDLLNATDYWNHFFEVSGTPTSPRYREAQGVFDKYGSQAPSGATGTNGTVTDVGTCTGTTSGPAGSANCPTATGSAKIICEAKKYDPVSYIFGAGHAGAKVYHQNCPTINTNDACALDCSGLVNMAVYDAFGVDGNWNTTSLVTDGGNWTHISLSQVQPGDLLLPDSGHVEIIDHVSGNTIYTFGAHNPHYPQPRQVGPTDYYHPQSGNVYLHYVGKGSSVSA
jgi:cell wall-associated NlpC family hydrolase